ncbi:MAG: PAS domain-containing protein, partial [Rhodocyclaceae bacterium]|nr:PAS domain-containing protein [Rhodocyclaceae bacterium]
IVESSNDVLAYVDRDLRYRVLNTPACQMLGRPRDELLGQEIRSALEPQIYATVEPLLRRALAGEEMRFTSERRYSDARHRVFDVAYLPFMPQGEVLGLVICMHDITNRVVAERSLASTQHALARAQEIAHIGTWVLDLRENVSTLSAVTMRLLDWPSDRISLAELMEIVHPDDRLALQHAVELATERGSLDSEHRLLVRGKHAWVHVTGDVGRDEHGQPVTIVGMVQDITAMREAQLDLEAYRDNLEHLVAARTAELEAAQTQVRLILDSTADGLFGLDGAGRITFINPAACETLAHMPKRLVGAASKCITQRTPAEHANDPDDNASEAEPDPFLPTLEAGETLRKEREIFWRSDGQPVTVAYACRPMVRHGTIVGAVVSFSDMGERLAAESARDRALQEAERLAQLRSEFLANMSHEIRTPLNAVLGLAQIGRSASMGRRAQSTFDGILEAGQLLLGIVNDILDFSKIEAGKLMLEQAPLALGQVLDRAVQLVAPAAHAKGLHFIVDEAPDLPQRCLGDGLRLSQVIVNLLANAVKFSERGSVRLYARRETCNLVLGVTDTGIGMSAEQAARLFAPFEQADGTTTRRFGGTGLGLAICKRLVQMMGGQIVVNSQLGAGSTFEVRLPLCAAEAAAPPERAYAVRLAGLPAHEALRFTAALAERGIDALVCTPDAIAAAPADLIVVAQQALDPATLAAANCELDRGRRLAVVAEPAQPDPQAGLRAGAQVLQRPLRARHVLELLTGQAGTPEPEIPAGSRLRGISILAAEDNEFNRMVLQEMLEMEGARLLCRENGQLALQTLMDATPGTFQLLITDIQMPVMDGYELARRVRQITPELPILGLTAHAMAEERKRCMAAGMVAHLCKPVDLQQLVAAVRRYALPADFGAAPAPGGKTGLDAQAAGESCCTACDTEHIGPDAEAKSCAAGTATDLPPGSSAGTAECLHAFDHVALNRRYSGKSEFVRRLLKRFIESQAGMPARLRQAAAQSELDDIAAIAHNLKGMAGALLAHPTETLASRTNAAARSQAADTGACAEQLAGTLETLLTGIAEHLKQD